MALSHSPSIVRSGLVFYYDMNNTRKSWKGAPVTNLYGSIDNSSNIRTPNTVHFWDGNSWSTTSPYTHPGVPGPVGTYLGKVYKFTSGALSSTWSGNSYGYMLKTMSTTNGQYNAMSCWVYISGGCNIDAIPVSIESATSTAGIAGIPSSYDMNSKGTWQRIGASCTASAGNMNFIPVYPQRYGVTDGSFTGFFMFAMPQVETNTYPSVGIETSRSSTEALLDFINNTVTASSITYNIDNTFSFNGSSNYLTVSSPVMPTDDFTIELVVYPTSFSNSPIVICPQNAGIDQFIQFNTNGTFIFKMAAGGDTGERSYTSSTACLLNSYNHIACVKSGSNVSLYMNGVLTTSTTSDTTASAGWGSTTWIVGQRGNSTYYFSGLIPILKAYNRGLTAAEVSQNFNAQRDRYGV